MSDGRTCVVTPVWQLVCVTVGPCGRTCVVMLVEQLICMTLARVAGPVGKLVYVTLACAARPVWSRLWQVAMVIVTVGPCGWTCVVMHEQQLVCVTLACVAGPVWQFVYVTLACLAGRVWSCLCGTWSV